MRVVCLTSSSAAAQAPGDIQQTIASRSCVCSGWVVDAGDHVAAADVHVVSQPHGHRHRGVCLVQLLVEGVDRLDGARHPARQDDDLVAGCMTPPADLTGHTRR
ncbi:hypothetical protein BJF82_13730 [Kytococcus sp. CUA-901]|nr:hypothetical protein BJF82_13730 [Kytococcus sp. CUA-901]